MKIAYRELLHEIDGWPRPLLDVSVGDADDLRVRCLVDSGAMNTLLPSWVANLAGIDCADAPAKTLAVAGSSTKARMVPTLLTIGEHSWGPRWASATRGRAAGVYSASSRSFATSW